MAFQRKTEILGIHVGGDRLYYAHLKRGLLGGWAPKLPIPAFEAWGSFPEGNPSGLRRFLSRIPSASGRAIYLALPRHHFFIRNLELPPMSREDALAAVEASLKISAHLPVAEIYYDIHLCPLADRRVHGLLIYARKQDVDPYLEACRTTGHRLELEGISPFILGIGSWLSRQHYSLPLALLLDQGQDRELGVFAKNGTLYSVAATDIESDTLRQNVAARYPEVGERFFSFSGSEAKLSELPVPAVDHCFSLPPVQENPAVAALAPVLAGQQPVCVDERPVKLKQVHPLPWLLLAAFLLAFFCGGLSCRAGEAGGILPQILTKLGEFLEQSEEVRRYIISSSIYPSILLSVGFLSILIIVGFVVPRFADIFADLGQQLPLSTRMLMSASHFLQRWWLVLSILLAVLIFGGRRLARTPKGKSFLDRLSLRLPGLGTLGLDIQVSRFARTLGTLIISGVPLLKAIDISGKVVANSLIRADIDRIYQQVKTGKRISQLMRDGGLFPVKMVQMVTLGEETGQIGKMLETAANELDRTIEIRIKRYLALVEPIAILLMGLIIGAVVISMLSAILGINDINF